MDRDFTELYNTPIPKERQAEYEQWLSKVNQILGRDLSKDKYSYDIQGAFMGGTMPDENLHWPDTWKKPNHPTFSDQSIYHGTDGYFGGTWHGDRYVPYDPNLESLWSFFK